MEKRSSSKNGTRLLTSGSAADKQRDPTCVGNNGNASISNSGNSKFVRVRKEFNYGQGGGGAVPKPRQTEYRKPAAQKSNLFHKKPRMCGGMMHNYSDRRFYDNNSEISGQGCNMSPSMAESGSVQRPGSKKQSLNHLLNFTLSPREHTNRTSGWKTRNNWQHRKAPRYNKEQFMQANCQFIVSELGECDYSLYEADPDLLVDWKAVEMIRINVHAIPSCPICLFPPLVAKITRCGHIYCWSCILHYLALSEKSWRKCPICYEAIHKQDLKSVIMSEKPEYCINKEMELQLMCRQKGSNVVVPVLGTNESQLTVRGSISSTALRKLGDSEIADRYSKILMASKQQVQDFHSTQRHQLEQRLQEEEDESEACFLQQALALLIDGEMVMGDCEERCSTDRASSTTAGHTPVGYKPVAAAAAAAATELPEAAEPMHLPPAADNDWFDSSSNCSDNEDDNASLEMAETRVASVHVAVDHGNVHVANESGTESVSNIGGAGHPEEESGGGPAAAGSSRDAGYTSLSTSHMHMATCHVSNRHLYYFYQASDGQHIYLHALNVRCLVKEYGSLECCPRTITATIVQLDHCTMAEDVRKKLRYLSHVPIKCEFQIAELRLNPPLVSMTTLKFFFVELQKRRDERQKHKNLERKWHRHVQIEENKKVGKFPVSRHNLRSESDFPLQQQAGDVTDIVPSTAAPLPLAATGEEWLQCSGRESTAPSFAQMLKASEGASVQQQVVWPSRAVSGATTRMAEGSDSNSDGEEPHEPPQPPQYNDSFSQAFQSALDNLHLTQPAETSAATDNVSVVAANPPGSGGKKGKKRNKQKLLFSTAMASRSK